MSLQSKLTIWQKIGMFFYSKRVFTGFIWLAIIFVGVMSYTTWMRREGFPSIDVPYGIVQVVSFGDSAEQLDEKFVLPVLEQLALDTSVKHVSSSASDQGAAIIVSFNDGTDVQKQLDGVKERLAGSLPSNGQLNYLKLNAGTLTNEGDDVLVSVHGEGLSAVELDQLASKIAPILKNKIPLAERVKPVELVESIVDSATGKSETLQVRFDRFFDHQTSGFEPSAIIAIKGVAGVDQLELYDQIEAAIKSDEISAVGSVAISANIAERIREQISGLQQNLLEGLIVVLIVSFVLISLRGSVITAIAMTTTVIATVGLLNLMGYTLNTIVLFSLVLCLALIVDDTTIIVEAIDAGLKKGGRFKDVVRDSFKKVARASATGTAVTILAFAPMLFISGILGEFIRAVPVTIITSLMVSLIVSFAFIPLMMQLSYGRLKDGKTKSKLRLMDKIEAGIGNGLARAIVWSTRTRGHSISMKVSAVLISIGFVVLGGFIFSKVEFNIFPSPKDGNEVVVTGIVVDRENAHIESTEILADKALAIVGEVTGDSLARVTLFDKNGPAGRDGFTASVLLVPYGSRDITSVEIAEQLQDRLVSAMPSLRITAEASSVGPPAGNFNVRIRADDVEKANKLAQDIKSFIETTQLTRADGTTARLKDSRATPPNLVVRDNEQRIITVTADFEDKDTSTLVKLAQAQIENKYTENVLFDQYGLSNDAITFDFGQEEENQESFASMGKAAGPLFFVMFVLMALLFRSFAQPILIFTALPFAFLGVATGLYSTDNPISFFSMLGVFALVGISLNNTILLTDYANQAQREGKRPVDAIAGAIRERLRPLLTTSITSVFALLPLALNDPFWEGLAFALIFGLISSTVLVLLVFPYFYLITENITTKTIRLFRRVVKTKRA